MMLSKRLGFHQATLFRNLQNSLPDMPKCSSTKNGQKISMPPLFFFFFFFCIEIKLASKTNWKSVFHHQLYRCTRWVSIPNIVFDIYMYVLLCSLTIELRLIYSYVKWFDRLALFYLLHNVCVFCTNDIRGNVFHWFCAGHNHFRIL